MDGIDILHRTPHQALDVLFIAIGTTAQACLDAAHTLGARGIGTTVVDPRLGLPRRPHPAPPDRPPPTRPDRRGRHRRRRDRHPHRPTQRRAGVTTPIHTLGLPATFLLHGERAGLLEQAGITGPALARSLLALRPAPAQHDLFPHLLPAHRDARRAP
ncbi:transketolase C-terminal domain-containing protein [Streptomyces sp. NPDC020794]|uniref:transketolase C-terminal domain-containing protein n=1 Tax=unclassified Streptomyces TaxID=2593676 RepID=UPI0036E354BB